MLTRGFFTRAFLITVDVFYLLKIHHPVCCVVFASSDSHKVYSRGAVPRAAWCQLMSALL